MQKARARGSSVISVIGFLMLILDSQTAHKGAVEGVELCIYTVLPALFPFFVISNIFNNSFCGNVNPLLRRICTFCNIPKGSESLLVTGLLSGYPIGAQAINETYKTGVLTKSVAHRMLGFCSNAGPSFIFGMVGCLFTSKYTVWIIWLIHILSALTTGALLPKAEANPININQKSRTTIIQAIKNSIDSILTVSAWVILFRIAITLAKKHILWALSEETGIAIIGITEITNGIHYLQQLSNEGMRFILSSTFLGFGGFCVLLQTISVTADVGAGLYFPGKVIQASISFLFATITQYVIFSSENCWDIPIPLLFTVFVIGVTTIFILFKKNSSIHRKNVI